jgi:hypothetical protein
MRNNFSVNGRIGESTSTIKSGYRIKTAVPLPKSFKTLQ